MRSHRRQPSPASGSQSRERKCGSWERIADGNGGRAGAEAGPRWDARRPAGQADTREGCSRAFPWAALHSSCRRRLVTGPQRLEQERRRDHPSLLGWSGGDSRLWLSSSSNPRPSQQRTASWPRQGPWRLSLLFPASLKESGCIREEKP